MDNLKASFEPLFVKLHLVIENFYYLSLYGWVKIQIIVQICACISVFKIQTHINLVAGQTKENQVCNSSIISFEKQTSKQTKDKPIVTVFGPSAAYFRCITEKCTIKLV